MSFYREFLEAWLKKIDVNAELLLDVGGGEKPISKARVNSWNVKECKILDNDPKFNPDILQDMNVSLEVYTHQVDTIFCLEVAEYIYNPIQFHKNLFELLVPEGTLYISYPSIYPVHQPEEFDYLRYTKRAIEKYLAGVGFNIVEIVPRRATVGSEDLFLFYNKERMHLFQKSDLPFHIGYMVKAIKPLK